MLRRFSARNINGFVSRASSSLSSVWNPTEEHAALRESLRSFVQKEVEPQAHDYNKREAFNIDLFRKLADFGLLGLTVDEAFGGSGMMDATAVCLVHEELSYSDPALCLSYLAHSLLFCNNLHVNGRTDQLGRFLPLACTGEHIGGMAMSEPNAGTDVLGLFTKAELEKDASGSDVYRLNGTKMWITNGTIDDNGTPGDIFLIYARTGPKRTDISQLVVERGMPGFSVGQKITDKLGMRASMTAELVFDNVLVPAESHLVGDENQALLCMMRNLEIERIGLAAMGLGIARRCLDEMIAYAREREAFGKDLYQFGQIQRMIALSYAEYMAGRSYVYSVANHLDLKTHGNGLDADGVKLYSAKMAKTVADRAIQVMGGYGYLGEYTVERLWRDAKLLEIGGGTNESHHKNMARDLRKMEKQLD